MSQELWLERIRVQTQFAEHQPGVENSHQPHHDETGHTQAAVLIDEIRAEQE